MIRVQFSLAGVLLSPCMLGKNSLAVFKGGGGKEKNLRRIPHVWMWEVAVGKQAKAGGENRTPITPSRYLFPAAFSQYPTVAVLSSNSSRWFLLHSQSAEGCVNVCRHGSPQISLGLWSLCNFNFVDAVCSVFGISPPRVRACVRPCA